MPTNKTENNAYELCNNKVKEENKDLICVPIKLKNTGQIVKDKAFCGDKYDLCTNELKNGVSLSKSILKTLGYYILWGFILLILVLLQLIIIPGSESGLYGAYTIMLIILLIAMPIYLAIRNRRVKGCYYQDDYKLKEIVEMETFELNNSSNICKIEGNNVILPKNESSFKERLEKILFKIL